MRSWTLARGGEPIARISKFVTREHVVHALALSAPGQPSSDQWLPSGAASPTGNSAWRESEKGTPSSCRMRRNQGEMYPGRRNPAAERGMQVCRPVRNFSRSIREASCQSARDVDSDPAYSVSIRRCCVARPSSLRPGIEGKVFFLALVNHVSTISAFHTSALQGTLDQVCPGLTSRSPRRKTASTRVFCRPKWCLNYGPHDVNLTILSLLYSRFG
jgi:hypothetical protein